MANYTEHYQLHQWEPEDPFLRTDFNEDLKKIDLSILDAKKASGCIEGAYTGNGGRNQIPLAVQPKFISVMAPHAGSSRTSDIFLAVGTANCMICFDSFGPHRYSKLTFQENGFIIDDSSEDGLNGAGQVNSYAAFY